MKKILSFILLLVLGLSIFCVSGCGGYNVEGLKDISVESCNYNNHPAAKIIFTNDNEGKFVGPTSTVTVVFYLDGNLYDTVTDQLTYGLIGFGRTYTAYVTSKNAIPGGNVTCKVTNWNINWYG